MKLSTVILASQRWHDARHSWHLADALGLHAAYTYDHLSWRNFRERPWFSMVPVLSGAASVTSRIRLGPLVTSPNFRHPLLLAKDLLAIDDISNGRLSIGVGSGGTGFDATVLGHEQWTNRERHLRFEEFTRTLEQLLREPASTIEGDYYRVVDSRQLPGPVQSPRPPLFLSALGPKSMALTVEIADGWVSLNNTGSDEPGSTYAAVASQVRALEEALVQAVVAQHGRLDLWVSNAGVSKMQRFLDVTPADLAFNFEVNTYGVFYCGQSAARAMIALGRPGCIINTASMAAKEGGVSFLSDYVASKFAVLGLTQAMAAELAAHQIRVNCVCPGYVATSMQSREITWEASLRGVDEETVRQSYLANTPLARLETPEDVAKVVAFLASDDASFITGEAISVNGGAYMD